MAKYTLVQNQKDVLTILLINRPPVQITPLSYGWCSGVLRIFIFWTHIDIFTLEFQVRHKLTIYVHWVVCAPTRFQFITPNLLLYVLCAMSIRVFIVSPFPFFSVGGPYCCFNISSLNRRMIMHFSRIRYLFISVRRMIYVCICRLNIYIHRLYPIIINYPGAVIL